MGSPHLAPGWDDDDFRMGRRNRRNAAAQSDAAAALADLVKPRFAQNGELKVRPWPIRHRTSLAKGGRSGRGLQDYIDRCEKSSLTETERQRLAEDGHLADMEEVAALYGNLGESREEKNRFWDAAYEHELSVRPSGQTTVCNHLLVNIPHWLNNPDSMWSIIHGIADLLDSYMHPADRERGMELGWSAAIHHPPVSKAIADALVGRLTEDREYKLLGDPRHIHAHIIYHDRPAWHGDDGCWRFGSTKARIGGASALMELRERIAAVINAEIERDGRSLWRVSGKNYRNLGVDVTPLKYESDKVYRARGKDLASIRATSYSAGVNDGTLSAADMERIRALFAETKRRDRAEALARGKDRRRAREERARDREFRQRVEDRLPATERQVAVVQILARFLEVSDLVDEAVFVSRAATTGLITMLRAAKRDMARPQAREEAIRLDLHDRLISGQRVVAAIRQELAQADRQVRFEKEARQVAERRTSLLSRDLAATLEQVEHLADQLRRADQQLAQERQIGQRMAERIRLLDLESGNIPRDALKSTHSPPAPPSDVPETIFVIEKSPGFGTRQIFLGEPKPGDHPIATTRADALDRKLAELAAERGIDRWSIANYSDKAVSEARQTERRQVEEHARVREQQARTKAAATTALRTAQQAAEERRAWLALIEAQRLDQAEMDARVGMRVSEELALRHPVQVPDPPATAKQLTTLFAMLEKCGRHLIPSDAPVTEAFATELIGHLQLASTPPPRLIEAPPPPELPQAARQTGVPQKRPRRGGFDGI